MATIGRDPQERHVRRSPYIPLFAALSVSLLGAFHVACDGQPAAERPSGDRSTTLRMADTRFMGLLPFYVADDLGYFQKSGVHIEWQDIREPGEAVKTFLAGNSDLVLSTFAGLLPAELRAPGTLRLLFPVYESSSNSSSAILVRPDSPIRSLVDLKGHRLGTYAGGTQRAYAILALSKAGLRVPDDVDVLQVATAAQVQSLLGGAFDALFTVEPHASIAIENGAIPIMTAVRPQLLADPFWVGALAVRSTLAQRNTTPLPSLLGALSKAVDTIHSEPLRARQVLARRLDLPERVAARCGLYEWEPHPGESQLKQIQAIVDQLVDAGQLPSPVAVSPLFFFPNPSTTGGPAPQ